MDKFAKYIKIKWYLVYENNIDMISKVIVGKSLPNWITKFKFLLY